MNDTEGNDTEGDDARGDDAERGARRARAWTERAREQLSAVESRLAARYQRHLHARCDPRDAREVLRQLAARRLLPLGHGLRQASTHDAGAAAGDGARHGRRAREPLRPAVAFLQLSRADRAALWPLRPLRTPDGAGGSSAAAGAAGPLAQAPHESVASARRAALRRLAERLGANRAGASAAGVGGIH